MRDIIRHRMAVGLVPYNDPLTERETTYMYFSTRANALFHRSLILRLLEHNNKNQTSDRFWVWRITPIWDTDKMKVVYIGDIEKTGSVHIDSPHFKMPHVYMPKNNTDFNIETDKYFRYSETQDMALKRRLDKYKWLVPYCRMCLKVYRQQIDLVDSEVVTQ